MKETHSRGLFLQQHLPVFLVLDTVSEAMFRSEWRHGSRVNSCTRSLNSVRSSAVGGKKPLGCLVEAARWAAIWSGLGLQRPR